MKSSFSVLAGICFIFSAFGNAGIFGGNGQTPTLGSTDRIQMVEEEVVMTPVRGNWPAGGVNQDLMHFRCTFLLRNLSGDAVTVPVGFPISTEALWSVPSGHYSAAELAARFSFVAGTDRETFPVRYVPYDRKKKFSSVFLWEMTFQPREEITLRVSYTVPGYTGLTPLRKEGLKQNAPYRCPYLQSLETAIGQIQMYVTETGGCWAGEIEKAVFRIEPFPFEEYLAKRGAFEETSAMREQRIRSIRKDFRKAMITPDLPLLISWRPERARWKETVSGRKRCLELTFAPFRPRGKEDNLRFAYLFPFFPRSVEQFETLLKILRKDAGDACARYEKRRESLEKLRRENPEAYRKKAARLSEPKPFLAGDEKNVADVILEFYGFRRDNPEIRDFLSAQCWHPAEPRPIDPALRKRLEEVSGASRGMDSP